MVNLHQQAEKHKMEHIK